MNDATPLLAIDNLVVEIQSMPALRGFTMHVAKGAMVSLVGRNGAGKTTLMRSIMDTSRRPGAWCGSKAAICRPVHAMRRGHSGSAICRKIAAWCRS